MPFKRSLEILPFEKVETRDVPVFTDDPDCLSKTFLQSASIDQTASSAHRTNMFPNFLRNKFSELSDS